jgi:UDP-N-acetylmuramate dehydrogenase
MALTVSPGPLLAERTTLRLGGRALAEVALPWPEDAQDLSGALSRLGGTPLALGRGSNLLAKGGELPLVLVRATCPALPREVAWQPGEVRVRAEAGFPLPRLLGWLRQRGYAGLEGLSGVPGAVGGAVAGNAGSYGVETGDRLFRALVWSPRGGLGWVPREGMELGYRHFAPWAGCDDFFLVLAAEFTLRREDPATVGARMAEAARKKAAAQPLHAASAGCVFKNPGPISAGKLLDECGFKGRRLGGMAFSEKHANFLVNQGDGTPEQAFELLDQARAAVARRFEVELELEVRVAP